MSKHHRQTAVTITADIESLPDEPIISDTICYVFTKTIAMEMMGKTYSRWPEAKDALMKAVYSHYGHMFDLCEKQQRKGRNFFAKKSYHSGERRRFEVHHIFECSKEQAKMGELDNLVMVAPLVHDEIHRNED